MVVFGFILLTTSNGAAGMTRAAVGSSKISSENPRAVSRWKGALWNDVERSPSSTKGADNADLPPSVTRPIWARISSSRLCTSTGSTPR